MLHKKQRRGATLVEFAVVVPIFLLFVMGLVEIGRAFMSSHLLTNAARVGCSQGITGTTVTTYVNGVVADASTANPNDNFTVTVSAKVSSLTWVPVNRFLT